MKYGIRYIERGVDAKTDSKLLDMLLEDDKSTLKSLSNDYMCKYTKVGDNGRAYEVKTGNYAYTFKTVEGGSFEDVLAKYNKILHKGSRISLENLEFTVVDSATKKAE